MRQIIGIPVVVLVSLTNACGDDDPRITPDAADLRDRPTFSTKESGLVFLERIIYAEEGEPPVQRGYITVNIVEPLPPAKAPVAGVCFDAWHETTSYWPNAWPEDASSLDVGEVTIRGDGLDAFTETPYPIREGAVPRRDYLGRQNDLAIAAELGPDSDRGSAEDVLGDGDSLFDVSVAGSETYPATTWEDAVYIPSQPKVTPPPDQPFDLDDVNEDGDLVITFEPGANANFPRGAISLYFVAFGRRAPDPAYQSEAYVSTACASLSRTLIVPAETVAKLKEDRVIAVLRSQLVGNMLYMDEDAPEAGRFDFVGTNGYFNSIAR